MLQYFDASPGSGGAPVKVRLPGGRPMRLRIIAQLTGRETT